MMRPDKQVPVLVFFQDQRNSRLDGDFENNAIPAGCGSGYSVANIFNGASELSGKPLRCCTEAVGLGLRQGAV